jgi:hypothetical protein
MNSFSSVFEPANPGGFKTANENFVRFYDV